MAKQFLTEYRLELGALLTLLFALLTVIGIVGVYLNLDDSNSLPSVLSVLEDLATPFGDWVAWLVVASPIGLIVCGWWLYDFVRKTRELTDLIDTPSKAKFVRNLDEIDYLAWSLPQRYEDRVIAKKKELKI